ncbi:MAG: hypothetical protein ABJA83_09900, partial [Burkholderiaceae bacterium]
LTYQWSRRSSSAPHFDVRSQMQHDSELANSGIGHVAQLAAVLASLKPHNIALFEHQYLLLVFGSFGLVVGRAHDRLKFSWDGREFFLDVSRSGFANLSATPAWRHVANTKLLNGQGLFDEILSRTRKEFAI